VWVSTGRREEAVALLGSLPATPPVLVALADAHRDAGPALQALGAAPGDPEAALAVARWSASRVEADAALASVTVPDARVLAARLERAVGRGDLEAAHAELAALQAIQPHGPETLRLARWVGCLDVGTVSAEAIGALWEARRRAIVHAGSLAAIDVLVEGARSCPAALALRGTEADLRTAVQLVPDDGGLKRALGRTLLDQGRPSEALPWLEDAAASGVVDPVALAVARADTAPDRRTELDVLVEAVEATRDPRLLERARGLAESLEVDDALDGVLRSAPLPPPADEATEEIVVVAEDSDARLARIVERLSELGYGEPVKRRNGRLHFPHQGLHRPWVTLHPDGRVDVQEDGRVLVKKYPWLEDSPMEWRIISKRKLKERRARVLEAIRGEVAEWRDMLCQEGLEERLLTEIPSVLDGIWHDGIGRGGSSLPTPAARRRELLEWWATRTCTPEGEAVRTVIARYLATEVQTSEWPVTPDELTEAQVLARCDTLVLPMP
jgi:hypothetical protein